MAVAVVPYASLFVLPGSLALCAGYFGIKHFFGIVLLRR